MNKAEEFRLVLIEIVKLIENENKDVKDLINNIRYICECKLEESLEDGPKNKRCINSEIL